jgi:ethanolamine utilization protein EutP
LKKLFLSGRSEAGKTSLTQAMKGEKPHYVKTQYTTTGQDTIDTPGEYAETKALAHALGCFAFDADVIAQVCAADEPFNLFPPAYDGVCNRPLIGIITRIDAPGANVPMVRQWMRECGCDPIFEVNNMTGQGIPALLDYLKGDPEKIPVEVAMARQKYGLPDWVPAPDEKAQ